MIRPTFQYSSALSILLLGLALTAHAQTFFSANTTVSNILNSDAVIGYAQASDYASKTQGTSPNVRFLNSNIHGFLYAFHSSNVYVYGGTVEGWLAANENSTLTIRDGRASRLQARDNSLVNLIGGSLEGLEAFNASQVTLYNSRLGKTLLAGDSTHVIVQGGNVAGNLLTYKQSAVQVTGGSIGGRVVASDSSTITLRDGSFAGKIVTFDNSVVNLNGVSVAGNLEANGSSTINLSGGMITGDLLAYNKSRISLSGGNVRGSLKASGGSALNICGTDLRVILSHPEARWVVDAYTEYTLFGKLRDGTTLDGKALLLDLSKGARLRFNDNLARMTYPPFQQGGR